MGNPLDHNQINLHMLGPFDYLVANALVLAADSVRLLVIRASRSIVANSLEWRWRAGWPKRPAVSEDGDAGGG